MSCSVAVPPGSPVFSPSRLPPNLLSFKNAAAAEPQHHLASSPFPASPLRRPFSLCAHHHHRSREREASPSRLSIKQPPLAPPPAAAAAAAAANSSPLSIKRRRPPPLLVPVATLDDHEVHAPSTDDAVIEEEGEGFAAYCRKGNGRRRLHMEDRHVAAVALGGDPHTAMFGVFDGHGGKAAAEFAAENMPRIMSQELRRADQGRATVEEAVTKSYLRTDDEFCRAHQGAAGGACCVTALLREGRLVVSNAGDCRAVLSRAGRAQALTTDHRASRPDERRRIESQGGLVIDCRGTWRVQGSLAVTRGVGDAHLKPWVVPEPDTTALQLDADCEFLILASDGLWDKVDDQEAVDVARRLCCTDDGGAIGRCCRRLVELAASRGSTDDISVLVVQLHRFSGMQLDS